MEHRGIGGRQHKVLSQLNVYIVACYDCSGDESLLNGTFDHGPCWSLPQVTEIRAKKVTWLSIAEIWG